MLEIRNIIRKCQIGKISAVLKTIFYTLKNLYIVGVVQIR